MIENYGSLGNGYNTADRISNGTLQRAKLQTSPNQNQKPYEVHLVKSDHEDFGITVISQNYRFIGKKNFTLIKALIFLIYFCLLTKPYFLKLRKT